MATMSVRFRTWPGVGFEISKIVIPMLPLPSWPFWFLPHAHTVPSDFSARLWYAPAAMAMTFERPGTGAGVALLLVDVWLNWLSPQPQTVPCANARGQEKCRKTMIAADTTPRPVIGTSRSIA